MFEKHERFTDLSTDVLAGNRPNSNNDHTLLSLKSHATQQRRLPCVELQEKALSIVRHFQNYNLP